MYDEDGNVVSITDGQPPDWEARTPRLPGLWKKGLEHEVCEKENLNIELIDVAWYNNKVEDLLTHIRNFQPSTLIIDWCNNRGGFMMEKITTSGIASRIRMEAEMFLISRK